MKKKLIGKVIGAIIAASMAFTCITAFNCVSVFAGTTNFNTQEINDSSNLSSSVVVNDEITIGNGCRVITSTVDGYTAIVDTRSKCESVDTVKNSIVVKPMATGDMVIKYNTQGKSRALQVTAAGATALNQIEKLTIAADTYSTATVPVTAGTTYYINGGGALSIVDITLPEAGPTITTSSSSVDVVASKTATFTATLNNPGNATTINVSAPGSTSATFERDTTVNDKVTGTVSVVVPSTAKNPITVTLSATGAESKTVTLNVVEAALTVDKTELTVYKGSSASVAASVNTGDEISVVSDKESEGITAAYADGKITVSVTSGATASSATITVSSGDLSQDIAVSVGTPISVKPTGTDTITYTFTGIEAGKRLTSDATLENGKTAYAGDDEGTYVEFREGGAYLYDDSKAAPAKLTIPVKASAGTLRVTGKVTPTNNVGSKWALVNIGNCIYIASDGKKMAAITNNTSSEGDNAGAVTKDQEITYDVTLDFDTLTASGTLTNGTSTQSFENIEFAGSKDSVDGIVFITNNGNSISEGNDRGLLIPYVSYTATATTTAGTKTQINNTKDFYCVDETALYIIHPVTETEMEADTLYLKNGDNKVAETDKVYEAVEFADGSSLSSADDFDGSYIYVVKVNGASADDITSTTAFTWGTTPENA